MGKWIEQDVLAIAKRVDDRYEYTVKGIRGKTWTERHSTRFNYVWVYTDEHAVGAMFGMSGTLTGARRNATSAGAARDRVQIYPIHLVCGEGCQHNI